MRRFILVSIQTDADDGRGQFVMAEIRRKIHDVGSEFEGFVSVGDIPFAENRPTHYTGENSTFDFDVLAAMYDRLMDRAHRAAKKWLSE